MPTFSSIGLHPDLHHRIVAKSSSSSTTTTTTTTFIHNPPSTVSISNDTNDTSSKYEPIFNSIYHVISTPMAFLNRNPNQQLYLTMETKKCNGNNDITTTTTTTNNDSSADTSNIRPISLQQIKRLRYEVAVACIQKSMMTHQSLASPPTDHRFLLYPTNHTSKRKCMNDTNDHNNNNNKKKKNDENSSITTSEPYSITTFTGMVTAADIIQKDFVRTSSPHYNTPFIPTGCSTLDHALLRLLGLSIRHIGITQCDNTREIGGIPLGYITQISGPPASGKTQFVLSIMASSVTASNIHSIYFIGNSYPNIVRATQRLYEIFSLTFPSQDRIAMLQKITCTVATTAYQVLHRLQEFETYLLSTIQQGRQQEVYQPTMLVIDSCSGCCPDSSNDGTHTTVLRVVGHVIHRLTRQYHIATIVINGTVSNTHNDHPTTIRNTINHPTDDTATMSLSMITPTMNNGRTNKPALGYRWNETIPDICVWFQQCSQKDKNKALIVEQSKIGTKQPNKKVTPTIVQVTIDRYPHHVTEDMTSSIYFCIDKKGIKDIEI